MLAYFLAIKFKLIISNFFNFAIIRSFVGVVCKISSVLFVTRMVSFKGDKDLPFKLEANELFLFRVSNTVPKFIEIVFFSLLHFFL